MAAKWTVQALGNTTEHNCVVAVYFRGADGLMLVFDVTSEESFENIRTWMADINKHVEKASVQKILVGNKADVSAESTPDTVRP